MELNHLPIRHNSQGAVRRAGLEMEFAGMELPEAAEHIRYCFGGRIERHQRFEYTVKDTELGDFRLELDAQVLKKMAERNYLRRFNIDPRDVRIDEALDEVETLLDKLARSVVPLEIVMPPVPYDDIARLEKLRDRLQQHCAKGTDVSWMHAFGLHINIEVPDLEVETLVGYLRAFMMLYDWLERAHHVDLTRRMTPFIDPFPKKYVKMVVDPGYAPDQKTLLNDYLEANATRNRPLDMTPVLAEIDPKRVRDALGDQKLHPRPALHYRLPDCDIEDPAWRYTAEWNRWVEVEQLAADTERLHRLARTYVDDYLKRLMPYGNAWADQLEREIHGAE